MELRRFIAVLWRRLYLIVFATLLVAGMTYILSVTSTPIYQATATLEINYGADPRSDQYSSLIVSERSAKTYVEQLKSAQLARDVAAALGVNLSPGQIAGMVRVEQLRDTQLIKLSAESPSPDLARDVATRMAEIFIATTSARQEARYQSAKRELDVQIADIEKQMSDTQKAMAALGDPRDTRNASMPEFARIERTRLETVLSSYQTRYVIMLKSAEDFRLAAARYSDNIALFAPAETPRSPVRPQVSLNLLLGILSGLVLGVASAFLLEYLDDTVKDPDDVQSALGLAALGSVMRMRGIKSPAEALVAATEPKSTVAESYRVLRTNFQFSGISNPHAGVVVTSAGPREGKSTTLANLGVMLAQAGKRVILVDTDLRRPSLHKLFGIRNDRGLTSLLLDPDAGLEGYLQPGGAEGLQILPSGPIPPNPAEILSSPLMARIVKELEERADLVLFDSPPVLSVADATLLAAATGNVVMVVAAGETRTDAALHARDALQRSNARILGVVLNKVEVGRGGYYYYYRRYYHYYGDGSSNGTDRRPTTADRGRGTDRGPTTADRGRGTDRGRQTGDRGPRTDD